MFLPFAAGYFVSYLFRTVNAVIAPDLVRDFSATPADLGLLTSAYFLAFAAFQLPLGLLLDRYGPGRVNAALLLFAAAGAALFAASRDLGTLVAGRALIGLGVSACLMASIKAFSQWFPMERLASLTGWIFFSGGLGALVSTAPVEAAAAAFGWRSVFAAVAVFTVVVAAVIALVVPQRPRAGHAETLDEQLRGLRRIFVSPVFWQIALLSMLTQGSFLAIQGLWAGPWLKDVAGLARPDVAGQLLFMAVATMAGAVSFGNLASRLMRRGVRAARLFAGGVAVFMAVQFAIALGWAWASPALWLLFGFFGAAGSLSYSILSKEFPVELTGRVNTAINLLVFVCAFAAQWGMGAIIQLWPQAGGHYAPEGYRAAFGLFLLLQALAFGWMLANRARADRSRR